MPQWSPPMSAFAGFRIERIENDPEPLIRSHCLWALSQLDSKLAAPIAERALKGDPDPLVLEEAKMILNPTGC